eukprot:EG_transcript_25270
MGEQKATVLQLLCEAFDVSRAQTAAVQRIFDDCDGDEEQIVSCLRTLSVVQRSYTPRRIANPVDGPSSVPYHTPDRRGLWRCPVCLAENEAVDECRECSRALPALPAIGSAVRAQSPPQSRGSSRGVLTSRSLSRASSSGSYHMPVQPADPFRAPESEDSDEFEGSGALLNGCAPPAPAPADDSDEYGYGEDDDDDGDVGA